MKALAFIKPDREGRPKFADNFGDAEKDVQVVEYQMVISEYNENDKAFLAKKRKYGDTGPEVYNLVLQHYLLVLFFKIARQPVW